VEREAVAKENERDNEAWRAAFEGVGAYAAQEERIVDQAVGTDGSPETMEAAKSALGEGRFEDAADTRFRPTPGGKRGRAL
jgi:hypothetical protein